jgi:hypothetical protein
MAQETERAELRMDPATLYLEEVFTDRRVGTIRRLTPVTDQGTPDAARPVVFLGEAHVLTPMGTLPISFEIPARTLAEAVAAYGSAAERGLEDTARQLEELRREQASSIVVPGAGGPGGGMGGPGGLPGLGGGLPGLGGGRRR